VKADPGQLQQVLVNLAVNARDAMPGGGHLVITTRNVDAVPVAASSGPGSLSGPCVLLSIADTGQGMDAETRSRVFEPFFTTKERGKGTGLGLSTVYGIVRQSGGEIRVQSEPGQGATFDVFLPRVEAAELEAVGRVTGPPSRGSETILVVEDQADVRRLAAEVLSRRGYRVLQASGGEDAVRLAVGEAGPIHLVLADVVMPGMSGPMVAQALKQTRPDLKVLFMSGYTDNEMRNEVETTSASAYIQKPFAPAVLAAKVRDVLDAGPGPTERGKGRHGAGPA
jgi:two-component system cell cycle sensor histidine kinase/response regulator CckA